MAGAETTVTTNASCPGKLGIELWAIEGGGHNPGFQENFAVDMFRWFEDH